MPISIRACTNDKRSIGYLNNLDEDQSLFIDVCDDYAEELQNIHTALGNNFDFTVGDYCLKVIRSYAVLDCCSRSMDG